VLAGCGEEYHVGVIEVATADKDVVVYEEGEVSVGTEVGLDAVEAPVEDGPLVIGGSFETGCVIVFVHGGGVWHVFDDDVGVAASEFP